MDITYILSTFSDISAQNTSTMLFNFSKAKACTYTKKKQNKEYFQNFTDFYLTIFSKTTA